MKLTAFFILITALQVSAKSYSQERVTVNFENTRLSKALKEVEKKSTFHFVYSNLVLTDKSRITLQARDIQVRELLGKLLENTGLTFSVMNNNLVVIKEEGEIIKDVILKGNVTDKATGRPLAGASIQVKGSNAGTTTDNNGNYSLNVPNDAVLVISSVGYSQMEISVNGRQEINITLEPSTTGLNEVVVVGYGTQKKVNLSGSVASVSGITLSESPSPTFTNLLEGRIAGLTIVQPTGEPGRDVGSIQIRGLGSYGASSTPLILVDGIVSSISNLSPQDIESVSVLKDAASASIYGSRGANGVILITTKKGKGGQSKVSYTNSFGTSSATVLPKFITNSATYMQMFNEAQERSGQPDLYTQGEIDAYKNNMGSAQYPNTDWMKYYFHNGAISSHNLSFAGGNDKSTHYISVGYQKQKGILDLYDYDRYNSVIDYNVKVKNWIKVGTNINMSYQNMLAPNFINDLITLLTYAQAPTFAPYLPDGSGRRANRDYADNGVVNRTVDEVYNEGAQYTKNYNLNAQGYVEVNPFKGLIWKTTGAFVFFNRDYKNRAHATSDPSYAYQPDANGNYVITSYGNPPFSGLMQSSERDLALTLNSTLNYAKDFGADHHLNVLFGYEQINNKSTSLGGSRSNFAGNSINELNGGPTTGWTNSGDASEYALQSLFGRVNYNYQGKYILEGDMRYDGTSRVDPRYRWGTFGGASAAWRISEENFIKDNVSWLTDFKLRASYGVLGNQEISNYPYQAVLSNTAYPFNSSLVPGALVTALPSSNLHWEKTATTDLGLDLSIFRDLLGVTFDWYQKNTTGILAQQSDLPISVGLTPPIINAGSMQNKGVELAVTHQNHIGEFTYGANFLIAFNHNKVTKVLAPTVGVFEVGLPYNSFYVFQWDGIFQSQDEINSSPAQPNSGNLKPGDLKIKDVNGDGKITPDDRISINPYPSYTYSFGVNAGWKGFNLSAFFQGVQGQKFLVNGWGIDPFYQGTAPTTDFLNAWTPENHSNTIPAIYQNGYPGVDGYTSTYFLKNASYLRLKDVNLSYTFSQKMIKAPWLKELTIYLTGSNLLTWTKYKGEDPERAGLGGTSPQNYAQFPQLKIFSGGVKISL